MLTDLLRQTKDNISYNARVKVYPDGSRSVLVASKPLFRGAGWEQADKKPKAAEIAADGSTEENAERARKRARAAVRDLARSNAFSYFVTLTLDAQRIDRYDFDAILKKLNVWLDNNVRRRGLKYILVPEHHKDGAIHFHGFFNDALPVVDSGVCDGGGHKVFNLPRWGFGFSTAIELYGDYSAAVAYVCKYIGKEGEKVGGRWYYSGGDLTKPEVFYFRWEDLQSVPENAWSFNIDELGVSCKMWEEKPEKPAKQRKK